MLPIVTLDFETLFSSRDKYTLKRMTTEAYVRSPQFKAHGVSIKFEHTPPQWHCGDLPDLFSYVPWHEVAVLCHHAHFDGLILAHHYGIRPRMWLDTMAMGRAVFGSHVNVALESLASHFNLRPKSVPYDRMDGKQWEEMDAQTRNDVATGACHDVDLTWNIFCRLSRGFPAEEFVLIDSTVRMFTEPVLVGATAALAELLQREQQRKQDALVALGVTAKQLNSDGQLIAILNSLGVDVEYKEGKNGPIPAFAKTDQFMRYLCDDDDPRVAAVAAARLDVSSALVETRLARLVQMSTRGAMCVYLNYCGAHTKRFSGGDRINWQNHPRSAEYPKSITAPAGCLCVVADASQIECRILNEFAGQTDVIEKFRRKEDPYIGIASKFYGEQIYKARDGDPRKEEMDAKRGTGKQLELSCGYGAGGPTIVTTARKGTYGPPVYLTDGQGMQARDLYRQDHPAVTGLWDEAGHLLGLIANGGTCVWRGILEIRNKKIYGPNGLALDYSTLNWGQWENKDKTIETGWRLRVRGEKGVRWEKIYGAKLIENVIQFLAGIHTKSAWVACARAGMKIVSMEHDKLIAVVRESDAQAALAYMQQEMQRPPTWMPHVPLDSEGYISKAIKK